MTLTIIIIGYNAAKELQFCLSSINKQKNINENIEILYIDDGSLDNSIHIFNSFNLKFQKRYIKHSKKLGRNNARNTGIKNATGDWCLFINSNISLDENVINNYLNEIKKRNYNILTGNIKYICPDKKFELYLNNYKRTINNYKTKQIIPYYYLLFSNACIKKTILQKIKFDEKLTGYGGSEMEISYRINKQNPILFVPDTFGTRLNHPSLKDHLKRIEAFGEKNIFFIYQKIKKNHLPNTFKLFYLFLNKSSIILLPLFYLIRWLLFNIITLLPDKKSYNIIKLLLGLSMIVGIAKNKYIYK